jgi:hypothetical protein
MKNFRLRLLAAMLVLCSSSVFGQNYTSGAAVTTPGLVVGEIRAFAFGTGAGIAGIEKQGWMPCVGQSLDNDAAAGGFPELKAALGLSWGSLDQAHDFNVPDLRGMFLRGWGPGTIPPGDTAGDPAADARTAPRPDMPAGSGGTIGAGGNAVASFQPAELLNHSHGVTIAGPAGGGGSFGGVSAYRWQTNQDAGVGSWWMDLTTMPPGGGGLETRPKNVSVLFAIFTGRVVVEHAATAQRKQ